LHGVSIVLHVSRCTIAKKLGVVAKIFPLEGGRLQIAVFVVCVTL